MTLRMRNEQAMEKNKKVPKILLCRCSKSALDGGASLRYYASTVKLSKADFHIGQNDRTNLTVYASNLDNYKTILKILKENEIKFYTYTLKQLKIKNIVLKRVRGNFTENDIKTEIDEMKISEVNIVKVSKIYFNKKNNDVYHFLIQLTSDSNHFRKYTENPFAKNRFFNVLIVGSDHRALSFSVSLHISVSHINPSDSYRFKFKKTKWSAFKNHIKENYNNTSPTNRNLSNKEIENHLHSIKNSVYEAIESTVPKYNPHDNMLNYINRKISKLHKDKSYLISTLNKLYKFNNGSLNFHTHIVNIKRLIEQVKISLKAEYILAYNKYWDYQHKSIDHRNPDSFFPKINKFFRPKERLNIEKLEIKEAEKLLLRREQSDAASFPTKDNRIIINNFKDILNIIGAYYETINSPRYSNIGTENKTLVDNKIIEGLMQGTVNSSELFNIYTYNIPIMFDQNSPNDPTIHSVAFADDFIVLIADRRPSIVQERLEAINLRINPSKCETILFRFRPLRFLNNNIRKEIKNFQISITSNGNHIITHKKNVRYLGVQINYLLRLNAHVYNQLNKAKNTFRANSKIFFNKNLSARVKMICYLLLIRPIITYASPGWWNVSASVMEKIRKFERSCLRASLHVYRNSDTKKFINNKFIYDKANVPRIDSFIIKLARDYYAKLKGSNNKASSGYLQPESFMFFDSIGYITSQNNIPLIYHIPRHSANKSIDISINPSQLNLKYSTKIPERNTKDKYKLNEKYWWLSNDPRTRDEVRRRGFRI
ncbi:hypothetical protein TSAR_003005 [Trichomalopsis sarcophagae]|uniref:Reverse transcriptase domain-containing protein n=1 Tax=Trichomalopsis sarcophagae TaxID=543379 RepID=A0A232F379_9HYME|nr:hypothetical protein TSAR_003005 [Trichomalopsis sarcophagae]